MADRRFWLASLLLLAACSDGGSPEPRPGRDLGPGDGEPGDAEPGDAEVDGKPGAEPGDDAAGDGAAGDGEPDQGDGTPDEDPYLAAPTIELTRLPAGELPVRVIDSNQVLIAPFPDTSLVNYTLWARLENTSTLPIRARALVGRAYGAGGHESLGLTETFAPPCLIGDVFEPCVLPGESFVITWTVRLDSVAQGQAITRVATHMQVSELPAETPRVPLSAELQEQRVQAVGEFYEIAGVLHNETAYRLEDVVVDVFPQGADGRIVGQHSLFTEDLAPDGEVTLPARLRPGSAATSFLWFARGKRVD